MRTLPTTKTITNFSFLFLWCYSLRLLLAAVAVAATLRSLHYILPSVCSIFLSFTHFTVRTRSCSRHRRRCFFLLSRFSENIDSIRIVVIAFESRKFRCWLATSSRLLCALDGVCAASARLQNWIKILVVAVIIVVDFDVKFPKSVIFFFTSQLLVAGCWCVFSTNSFSSITQFLTLFFLLLSSSSIACSLQGS